MIAITKMPQGTTAIKYNGTLLAVHPLSATTSGTREYYNIPEEEAVYEWLEKEFAERIEEIKAND